MTRRKFKLSHSIFGLLFILALEGLLLYLWPANTMALLILGFAAVGSLVTLYVATEVVEEVRSPSHMVVLLSVIVAEFVLFFACEYWYLILLSPTSFPTLPPDVVSLLLHSMMVFVFNPLYLPGGHAWPHTPPYQYRQFDGPGALYPPEYLPVPPLQAIKLVLVLGFKLFEFGFEFAHALVGFVLHIDQRVVSRIKRLDKLVEL